MTPAMLRLAVAVVRAWTHFYTWRLPPGLRDARRDEIDSDLWESAHDPAPDRRLRLPLRMVARMLIGMPDDLGWRFEQVHALDGSMRMRLAVTLGAAGVLVVWLAIALRASPMPDLPSPPRFPFRVVKAPPPPPPPPPPCAPPGFPSSGNRDCVR